jgi:hypothetical protein
VPAHTPGVFVKECGSAQVIHQFLRWRTRGYWFLDHGGATPVMRA